MKHVCSCPVIARSSDLQATANSPDLQASVDSCDLQGTADSSRLQAPDGFPDTPPIACSSASYSTFLDGNTKHPDPVPHRSGSSTVLSVAIEDCGITTISKSTLRNMWNKAERLVRSSGSILKVPWNSDKRARLVMSSSSDHPHLVMTRKGMYSCDDKCMMFKGFSLCSHVIAAAHDNNDLHSLLEYHKQTKGGPNLTAIASQGMPSGSGRIGGVPKRKRKSVTVPIETHSIRQCLQNSSGDRRSSTLSYGVETTSNIEQGSLSSTSMGHLLSSTSVFEPQSLRASSLRASSLGTVNCQPQVHPTVTATSSSFHGPCQSPSLYLTPATNHLPSVSSGHSTPIPQTNTSSIGFLVGTNVSICTSPSTSVVPSQTTATQCLIPGRHQVTTNPFILKLKTRHIKVCQSCRKDYEGANDTMGLVVGRAER